MTQALADAYIGVGPRRRTDDYAVIASVPRSGTTYIHAVLSQLGCNPGHEMVFSSSGSRYDPPDWLTVEVSGFAGLHPFTNDGPVLHQIRHPLKVISSLWSLNMLGLGIPSDPESVAAWYLNVFANNEKAADWTYRIEYFGPSHLETLCDYLNVECRLSVLDEVPTDTNSRPRHDLSLGDLGPWGDQVAEIMARFDYEVTDG